MAKSIGGERGLFLSVLFDLSAIGFVLGAFALLSPGISNLSYSTLPEWYRPLNYISLVISAATLYGIWMWKKWGIYLLAVGYVLSLGSTFMVYSGTEAGAVGMYGGVVGIVVMAGLWYWAIYRKWSKFK